MYPRETTVSEKEREYNNPGRVEYRNFYPMPFPPCSSYLCF